MARQSVRFVQNTDSNIVVANERPVSVHVPTFDLPGASYATVSPPWHPPQTIALTDWYVVAGSVGTSTLTLAVTMGDNIFDVDGRFVGAIDLPATSRVVVGKVQIPNQVYNYAIIEPQNWIKVGLSGASGHSDITVQIYAKAV